ncbi:SWIM zinc finger family protein [Kitasatospora viridis]|uniref:SWIM zinc finger protein n=1 Tax=Kitasatospora viridis TaxID=281105 RepID=A0A561UJK7_9ACTN|nr:SWIM zinc finger family protein [Kitasatospora viridis]TWF99553.1 hypothetical protein FHX73_113400 [Kitasatospora viridis]
MVDRSSRRAEQRAARVAAGARELRLRLADRVRRGLAEGGAGDWAEVAARMVDAQAPGLAAGARELADLTGERQLAGYALLDLLAAACERIDELPGPLAATVRTRVGYTVEAADLLAGPTVRDSWLVLGGDRSETPEKLTRRRTWLLGARTGRTALLLDYARPDAPAGPALPPGTRLDAELAFHPAAVPLRAVLGTRHGEPAPGPPFPPPGAGLLDATARYGEAVAADPWTEAVPVLLDAVVPVPGELPKDWLLTDGHHALPVHPATTGPARWLLAAVSAGHPVTVFGECGHQGFAPVTVWDEAGDPVPLGAAR